MNLSYFVWAVIAVYFLVLDRLLEKCRWLYFENFEQKEDLLTSNEQLWYCRNLGNLGGPIKLRAVSIVTNFSSACHLNGCPPLP